MHKIEVKISKQVIGCSRYRFNVVLIFDFLGRHNWFLAFFFGEIIFPNLPFAQKNLELVLGQNGVSLQNEGQANLHLKNSKNRTTLYFASVV